MSRITERKVLAKHLSSPPDLLVGRCIARTANRITETKTDYHHVFVIRLCAKRQDRWDCVRRNAFKRPVFGQETLITKVQCQCESIRLLIGEQQAQIIKRRLQIRKLALAADSRCDVDLGCTLRARVVQLQIEFATDLPDPESATGRVGVVVVRSVPVFPREQFTAKLFGFDVFVATGQV